MPLLAAASTGCATHQPPASCAGLGREPARPLTQLVGWDGLPYSYAGEVRRLQRHQCRADLGNRAASVAVGRAYEAGAGVPPDAARAAALYAAAAQDRPAFTSIYSPPVQVGGAGQMLLLANPDAGPGDAEAKYRLGRMLIEGRGIMADRSRGQSLVDEAVAQGFVPSAP